MSMKVDARRIRETRISKAWSQEHMADVTGLGLRTIQRIKKTGCASHESIAAIASVLVLPVDELILAQEPRRGMAAELLRNRHLWSLFGLLSRSLRHSPTLRPSPSLHLAWIRRSCRRMTKGDHRTGATANGCRVEPGMTLQVIK